MNRLALVAAAIIGLAAGCGLSQASASTYTMSFTATDFFGTVDPTDTGPYPTFSGSLDLDLDASASYTFEAGHVTSYTFTLPAGFGFSDPASSLLLNYDPSAGIQIYPASYLTFGVPQPNDFALGTIGPGAWAFGYADSTGNQYLSFNVQVRVTPALYASTPLPGSLGLLLTALGGAGGLALLRRRAVVPVPASA